MILSNIFYKCGEFGPFILFIISCFLLRNKETLLYYYNIGFFLDNIINIVLKGIFQQPRPSQDIKQFNLAINNGKRFIFKDGVPFDIYGMPSGHAQSSFYSTIFIYLSFKNNNILFMYIVVCIIILSQRVVYKFHSILQVIIGSIIGLLLGYYGYYISQQNLIGIIREKPDDNAPL
jgi:membrane-associated phospholipid phosphatase